MKIKNLLLITFLMSLSLVFAGCDDDDSDSLCGNGNIDQLEECDGVNLNGKVCNNIVPNTSGTLSCKSDCTYDTTECAAAECGDGIMNGNEQCDGEDFGGATCADYEGFSGGTLSCNATLCTVDTSSCEHSCNVEGFFSSCNIMGGNYECCPINDMQADCLAPFTDGAGYCFQSCGGDDDCGWNYYCEAGLTNHCYYAFCGGGAESTPINSSCQLGDKEGWCYPMWNAMDDAGVCFENGTAGHGEACYRDDNNPVDGVADVDPATQCEDGICIVDDGEVDGHCINFCDPVAAYEGNDTCPENWNCFNYSDFDLDETSDTLLFREADYGICYPMQDGLDTLLDTALLTCDLLTGNVLKTGDPCPTGQTCKMGYRGSLQGICQDTDTPALLEGEDCTMPTTANPNAVCEEGTNCYYAKPTSDATADWTVIQCLRICDANAADADAACADLMTDDATPVPFTCLSLSQYFTEGNTLPMDTSTTPPTAETSPTPFGFCVPPRQ